MFNKHIILSGLQSSIKMIHLIMLAAVRKGYKWSATCRMSVLCRVSCVPTSCVHIWFVSCPCFMSLWVHLCPAVCMWLCVNYPVYISPVFWVWFRLVHLWLPGVSCLSALSCPALMCSLKTIIWVYILVCVFLYPPSCVHRDRRPDLTVSGAHSPRFVFRFFSNVFVLVPVCLSRKSPLVISP